MSWPVKIPEALVLPYGSTNGFMIDFVSIFGKLTVLKMLRGYECPYTTREVFELSLYKACFEKLGVELAAVCEQHTGSEEFMGSGDWSGKLYIDQCRSVSSVSNKNLGFGFLEPIRATKSNTAAIARRFLKQQAPKPGAAAPLFEVGGTYIVTPDLRIVYSHSPRFPSDIASTGLILYICRNWALSNNPSPMLSVTDPNAGHIYDIPEKRSTWMPQLTKKPALSTSSASTSLSSSTVIAKRKRASFLW